ncbi:MAG: AcvB/VirJ family lysyl-phosphatidylglycerol hydrolase [Gemmatimonadales bacterium]
MPLTITTLLTTLTATLGVANPVAVRLGPSDSTSIGGVPVVEIPAGSTASSTLAVILSGDGGWAAGDRAMAAELAESGVGVVGIDVPSYLRVKRTPDEAGADLDRLLEHYLQTWHKSKVILIGYSHGADIVPFMASRLPQDLKSRVLLVAMLGLSSSASFEFHFSDVVADISHQGDLPTLPEVEKLRGIPLLCVKGEGERHSFCDELPPSLAQVEVHPGGHRIVGSRGRATAEIVLTAVKAKEI